LGFVYESDLVQIGTHPMSPMFLVRCNSTTDAVQLENQMILQTVKSLIPASDDDYSSDGEMEQATVKPADTNGTSGGKLYKSCVTAYMITYQARNIRGQTTNPTIIKTPCSAHCTLPNCTPCPSQNTQTLISRPTLRGSDSKFALPRPVSPGPPYSA